MNEKQIALAKRVVACKGWRWMPGMLDVHGGRVVSVEGGLLRLDYRDDDDPIRTSASACLPDLTDPATLGCLLACVREAWRYPSAHPMPWGHTKFKPEPVGWSVMLGADDTLPNATLSAPTEAEALVAALEAAP
jgi:hypothetical protein